VCVVGLPNRIPDANQSIVPHRQNRDRLVGRSGTAEKIDKDSSASGVLIGQQREVLVVAQTVLHFDAAALFVDHHVAG